ncbi:Glycosyltransferase involved in cell wall bisynthesis [Tardiphaga sp. OK246]|uniref:glycosyltransferase family A protein n=1 Tax=Tardiphaga sp. OK246 TaxID=1855307 RepID=UPI000B6BD0D8|nr:glycosyltransferase family A protein [Tardiphaga sp. OK246]SNT63969.1 Glycosyltransferase involved in cell wall bisynthesis [Tardiphaga sp. OK246]
MNRPVSLERLDVSFVVNIHAGHRYLWRTMQSLEAAAIYARSERLRIELLFVLDRSPLPTKSWIRAYRTDLFDRVRIEEVDNGSLGLSRQAGLLLAGAEYIQFCDEDDLISSNVTLVSYRVAQAAGPRSLVIPEFLFAFGAQAYLAHYASSDHVPKLSIIAQHPFVSRLFVHHSIVETLAYDDVPLGSGYAYEDWHFNSIALARGFTFEIAPATVIYYRQRAKSLLQNMNASSVGLPPPSPLYEPMTFIVTCRDDFHRLQLGELPAFDPKAMLDRFVADADILDATLAAHEIDAAIVVDTLKEAPLLSNLVGDFTLGQAYFKACKQILAEKFDVVILCETPDAYARSGTLDATFTRGSGAGSMLVLLDGGPHDRSSLYYLPPCAVAIDLRSLEPGLSDMQVDIVALRLIEAAAPQADIHLSASRFGSRFVRKFAALLADVDFIFHCSPTDGDGRSEIMRGHEFNFISEFGDDIDWIVCADAAAIKTYRSRLDWLNAKLIRKEDLSQRARRLTALGPPTTK